MGRSIPKSDGRAIPIPGIPFHGDSFVKPTENKGIMSGPIRKPRSQGRRMRPRGSRPDVQLGRVTQPDGSTLITYGSGPRRKERGGSIGRRMPPRKLSDPDFKFREPGLSRYSGSNLRRQNSDSTYISILPVLVFTLAG